MPDKNKSSRPPDEDAREEKSTAPGDLKDSARDEERLQPEIAYIEIPDVDEIPGQEHVHVPPLGELADTTISSADEEGENIFGDDDLGGSDAKIPGQ